MAGIASLESGLTQERARLLEYAGLLATARALLSIGRVPDYDPAKLEEEGSAIQVSISNIEGVLDKERTKLALIDAGITANIDVLKAHGVVCQVAFGGDHAWQILEYFDTVGQERQWKKRRCSRCPTEERLGR